MPLGTTVTSLLATGKRLVYQNVAIEPLDFSHCDERCTQSLAAESGEVDTHTDEYSRLSREGEGLLYPQIALAEASKYASPRVAT
jgi:hypothetical protein